MDSEAFETSKIEMFGVLHVLSMVFDICQTRPKRMTPSEIAERHAVDERTIYLIASGRTHRKIIKPFAKDFKAACADRRLGRKSSAASTRVRKRIARQFKSVISPDSNFKLSYGRLLGDSESLGMIRFGQCDKEMLDIILRCDRVKAASGRPFLFTSEVVAVMFSMGYRLC